MRTRTILLACLFGLTSLYGCDKGSEEAKTSTASAPAKKISIAVIPKGTTHEFWKSIHAGANKAGDELGVEIVWKGPLKESDREEQIKVVEDFVTRGVSGIVLAPLDDTALRGPVHDAVAAGIPVVIIDSDLKSDDYTSFAATDNYKGGQMAGEHLVQLLGDKGKIVVLRYQEGSASTENREKGFLDEITKHSGITVVSSNQYGGATTETAYAASENLLAPLKSGDGLSIDGIFCPNESTTFGMLRALQDGGFAGKVKFVGFDASPKLVQGLKDGQIQGLVVQNPFHMGEMGVRTLVAHLRGEKVEKRIDTGAALVTSQNMNDPSITAILNPDLARWLK